jgi:hypothetical protein
MGIFEKITGAPTNEELDAALKSQQAQCGRVAEAAGKPFEDLSPSEVVHFGILAEIPNFGTVGEEIKKKLEPRPGNVPEETLRKRVELRDKLLEIQKLVDQI